MSRRPRRRRTVAASRRACACPRGDTGLDALGLTVPELAEATAVQTHLRELPARAVRRDLVWFAFDALCEAATGVSDHLALAERFPTLVLDGVPRRPRSPRTDGRGSPTRWTWPATVTSGSSSSAPPPGRPPRRPGPHPRPGPHGEPPRHAPADGPRRSGAADRDVGPLSGDRLSGDRRHWSVAVAVAVVRVRARRVGEGPRGHAPASEVCLLRVPPQA
ncbi:AFG1/ZapE family ATPase [Streptomyces sp. PanSC19]|uniref:AFG1/ZapE family ATPase n=1 Tax=Streptomyces sp. PanSC19 TaxID=1520455 RepID=UPI00288A4212|nr:AFG1/ZapE family ATPase [Streptomyces sp. PanSC19]